MSIDFDPEKEYGMFIPFCGTDKDVWRDIAIFNAKQHIPEGLKITIAHKGFTAAWRYPHDPELVPPDWEHEESST